MATGGAGEWGFKKTTFSKEGTMGAGAELWRER